MKISFKLPAIAIDDDGHEQEIELAFEVCPAGLFVSNGHVSGGFQLLGGGMESCLQAAFSFKDSHPFMVKSNEKLLSLCMATHSQSTNESPRGENTTEPKETCHG